MPRLAHGESLSLEQLQDAQRELASYAAENDLGFLAARVAVPERFDLLFLDLQRDPANLLPKSANTVKHLKALGGTMILATVGTLVMRRSLRSTPILVNSSTMTSVLS
jgi:hypothetical protein